MSQENIDLVRRLFAVYNERSFVENVDLIHPDMVWDMSRVQLPDAASYVGPVAFRDFAKKWAEGFATEHMEPQEMIDTEDQVVVMVDHHAQGKASGAEVGQRFAMVWTLRGGRAVRMDLYRTRDEALEAVGLSEQDAQA
jgi:ketosteroid isomerase-like protein